MSPDGATAVLKAPSAPSDDPAGQLTERRERLRRRRTVRDGYTTAQAAGVLGRAEVTARTRCRRGRRGPCRRDRDRAATRRDGGPSLKTGPSTRHSSEEDGR
jgi:hypothetical protein